MYISTKRKVLKRETADFMTGKVLSTANQGVTKGFGTRSCKKEILFQSRTTKKHFANT